MKALAFMQNMWVRDPERVRAFIAQYGDRYRRRAIHTFLFAGCFSGRRLKAAFGDELCASIIWEESTPEVTGDPKIVLPADPDHIRRALQEHQPAVVLTFGHIAYKAVAPLWREKPLIQCAHPAARFPGILDSLKRAARTLRELQALEVAGG